LLQDVAIKEIRLENEDEGIPSTALREISLLQELNHPYVVGLQDIVCEEEKLHLIFEFIDRDLKHHIERKRAMGLGGEEIKSILY
jgi:serine/threonine protein kinase